MASFSTTNPLLAQGTGTGTPNTQPMTGTGFNANARINWSITAITSGASGVSVQSGSTTANASGSATNNVILTNAATVNSAWTLTASDGTNVASTGVIVAPAAAATGYDLLMFDIVGTVDTAYLWIRATTSTAAIYEQLPLIPGVLAGYTASSPQLQQIPPPTAGTIFVSCYVLNIAALGGWIPGALFRGAKQA